MYTHGAYYIKIDIIIMDIINFTIFVNIIMWYPKSAVLIRIRTPLST